MSMSVKTKKYFNQPSRTKQSFKAECDINLIMKRFKKVMSADYLTKFNSYVGGQFGDFSVVSDYRTAIEQVSQAKGVFGALPAKVRSRFSNDPASFLDFCHDPRNFDEMVSLGLATKRAPVQDAPSKIDGKDAVKSA
jgi:phage internal scaffolding protein|nr:MAG: internal scaffolding protein [Microviridae sp.]